MCPPAVESSLQPGTAVPPELGRTDLLMDQVGEPEVDPKSESSPSSKGEPETGGQQDSSQDIEPAATLEKSSTMPPAVPIDARAIVRLTQCQQCSLPLRSPMTLPCGRSLCTTTCLPESFKRENITFPLSLGRTQGFVCPFRLCGQEHSLADCAQDVTLTKVMEKIALEVATYRPQHPNTATMLQEKVRPRTEEELAQIQSAGTGEPVARSHVSDGGRLAATYTMAEQGQLRYDSEVEYIIPESQESDQPEHLDRILLSKISASVQQEMDCQLCWNLLHDPLTTPCGHTFCRSCVARILDHSDACPFCRKPLQLPPGVRDVFGNERLHKMLETFCPEALEARAQAIALERETMKTDIPIFVCTLSYPGMPTFLHIFEPRYRLMMRRVLESESKTFGMVMHNGRRVPQGEDLGPNCYFMRQGTLLRIVNSAFFPDGRSLIEAIGVSRFNVTSWREEDGYVVSKVERIDDVPIEQEERLEAEDVQRVIPYDPENLEPGMTDPIAEIETVPTAELLAIATEFVARMRGASQPWLNQRMLESFGQPPVDNPRTFPYWFASVLPITEAEKYHLLGTNSVRERLKMTARWVRRIEAQRWYSINSDSCTVA